MNNDFWSLVKRALCRFRISVKRFSSLLIHWSARRVNWWDMCKFLRKRIRKRKKAQTVGVSCEVLCASAYVLSGHHFADDVFKCIFLNENIWISLKISLEFVPKVPVSNIPALVQIEVGAVKATSHYLNQVCLVYWCIYIYVTRPQWSTWTSTLSPAQPGSLI